MLTRRQLRELKEIIDNTIQDKKESELSQSLKKDDDYAVVEHAKNENENENENEKKELEVNIDFDEASKAWRENKRSSGNGCYKYVCSVIVAKTGIKCEKVVKTGYAFCSLHSKNNIYIHP
jgi:hypothetical protein